MIHLLQMILIIIKPGARLVSYNWFCADRYTVFISIKAGLIYTQGLKYTPGSAAEEWNKRLDPFNRRVPKLLNFINIKIVPYIMEN